MSPWMRIWSRRLAAGAVAVLTVGATASMVVAASHAKHERGASTVGVKTHVTLHLTIETGKMLHRPGWPKFLANGRSSATIRLPAHALVTVVLRSYDPGASATPAHFALVDGTVGNIVKVDGRAIRGVKPADVAHTFTIIGLDLNAPVPVVPPGKKFITETFQFVTGNPGTYGWQCYAPCGTGSSGWDGPMVTPGWMMGNVVVGR